RHGAGGTRRELVMKRSLSALVLLALGAVAVLVSGALDLGLLFADGIDAAAANDRELLGGALGPALRSGLRPQTPLAHVARAVQDGGQTPAVPDPGPPVAAFVWSPTPPISGEPVAFTSTTTAGLAPLTTTWTFCDGTGSIAAPNPGNTARATPND